MESQVLHTVWCNIAGEAAGEIWNWSFLGVKGLKADLDGTTLTHDCRMQLAHVIHTTRIASCKSTSQLPQDCRIRQLEKNCRSLKHVSKPCDNRTQVMTWASCMRRLCRLNRPVPFLPLALTLRVWTGLNARIAFRCYVITLGSEGNSLCDRCCLPPL